MDSDPRADAPDEQLLAAWAEGDKAAAATLIRRYSDDLHQFFKSKLQGDVSDLIQQSLLGCLEVRGKNKPVMSFRAYLFGVARKRLYSHLSAQSRARELSPSLTSLADLRSSPTSKLARHERRALLLRALQSLPLDLQVLLELFYWQGLVAPDLAAIYEVPEGTIRSRIRRARELLQQEVVRAGGDQGAVDGAADFEAWSASLRELVVGAANDS